MGRAASSAFMPPWNRASKQVRATAMELPLDITIIPDSRRSPEKRDLKPHKLSPPSPCSPSLIKIERTHVPISHLLELIIQDIIYKESENYNQDHVIF